MNVKFFYVSLAYNQGETCVTLNVICVHKCLILYAMEDFVQFSAQKQVDVAVGQIEILTFKEVKVKILKDFFWSSTLSKIPAMGFNQFEVF